MTTAESKTPWYVWPWLALMLLFRALAAVATGSRDYRRELPGKLRRMNLLLLLLVAALLVVGILFIYGAGQQIGGVMAGYWLRQCKWIFLGTLAMIGLAGLDYRRLGRMAGAVYGGSLFLLVLVLLIGKRINGAKSWLGAGPANIQPSEVAKFGLLLAVAWLAAAGRGRTKDWGRGLAFIALTIIPVALIGLQPDFGSAIVLPPITLAILFVSGMRRRWLVYLALLAVLLAPPVYQYGLSDHQKERLLTFVDSERDLAGRGWNARQSLLAVASGGLYGKGYMQGKMHTLGFLPRRVAPTDFIFSVIAEESGFLGSAILISCFGAILLLAVYIASKARDDFGRNLAAGIAALIGLHFFVNVGMTMRVAPIIGIPLPLVSYGGSFLIVTMACMGVLQSVYIHRRQ